MQTIRWIFVSFLPLCGGGCVAGRVHSPARSGRILARHVPLAAVDRAGHVRSQRRLGRAGGVAAVETVDAGFHPLLAGQLPGRLVRVPLVRTPGRVRVRPVEVPGHLVSASAHGYHLLALPGPRQLGIGGVDLLPGLDLHQVGLARGQLQGMLQQHLRLLHGNRVLQHFSGGVHIGHARRRQQLHRSLSGGLHSRLLHPRRGQAAAQQDILLVRHHRRHPANKSD